VAAAVGEAVAAPTVWTSGDRGGAAAAGILLRATTAICAAGAGRYSARTTLVAVDATNGDINGTTSAGNASRSDSLVLSPLQAAARAVIAATLTISAGSELASWS
jgi:hypothetical protein